MEAPKHSAIVADDEEEEDSAVFVPSGASSAAAPSAPSTYPSSLEDPAMLALNMRIKNLDTGETCDISDLDAVFPQTMTIDTFKRQKKAKQPVKPSELGAAETEEERTQKRSALGFIARVKRAFAGGGGSLKAGLQPNVVKVKSHGNGAPELPELRVIQELQHHNGPIWAAKVSPDGQFLATCGQDSVVRVWAVVNTQVARQLEEKARDRRQDGEQAQRTIPAELGGREVLVGTPYRMFSGHKNDVIDLAWSKANFLLSASIDRTVRLWHVSRSRCLRMFQHSDFVTAVAFHPIEDKYFLSGSFDKKLRLWNIPDHCVVEWAQTANVVTSVAFAPHGKMAVAGLYNGQCVFYQTENLKYHTQVDCRNRRGKNKKGRKVTGLQFSASGQHLLVTTNDSRVRLYDLDDYSPLCKYKGLQNEELQIRAVFSEDGKYVTCGSEDQCAFVWPTSLEEGAGGVRKRKQQKIETYSYFKVGSAQSPTVSSCQFLPRATLKLTGDADNNKQLMVTTEETGLIKIFECRKAM